MAGRSTEPFKVIGKRLAALREASGLTQRALGDRIERPHSYIGKLELAERRLDLLDLAALAGAFALTPAQMVDFLLGSLEVQDVLAQSTVERL